MAREKKITKVYSMLAISIKEKNKTGMGGRVAVLNRLAGGKLLFELKS